jgi:hypothetical protein
MEVKVYVNPHLKSEVQKISFLFPKKVSDDIRVSIAADEQGNLSISRANELREHALHGHLPAI